MNIASHINFPCEHRTKRFPQSAPSVSDSREAKFGLVSVRCNFSFIRCSMGILIPLLLLLIVSVAFGQKTEDLPYEQLEERVITIFNSSCAQTGCHGGAGPQQGMSLNEDNFFGHTVNSPSRERPDLDLVEPGKPDSSYLFMKVNGSEDIIGVQMPLTGELDDDEVETIRQWIKKIPKEGKTASRSREAAPKYAHAFDAWTAINTPTNRMVDKGKWLFLIAHRFNPKISSGYDQFYGLDGSANILLSMGYALSDNTLVNLGRSRINGTVNAQVKHQFLRQTLSGSTPLGITALGTVNWASTAQTERLDSPPFTYTGQVSLTRELMDGVGVTVAPGITFNPDMENQGENPLVTLGMGGRWRMHRNIYLIGEWNPILTGYTLTNTLGNFNRFDSWGTGIEISVGAHVFQIFLTNSFGTTTNQYLRGGDLDIRNESLRLGFNIYRILNF